MRLQLSVAALLLWAPVLPSWLYVTSVVGSGTGWGNEPVRFVFIPLALAGIAIALHRLLRGVPNAWAVSALASPFVAFLALQTLG